MLGEGVHPLHPRQQIGLLLLEQHGPIQCLLKTAAAAMALAAGEHDPASGSPLQEGEVGLGVTRAIDQHAATSTTPLQLQPPGTAALTVTTGRKQPQPRLHLLGRAAGIPGTWNHGGHVGTVLNHSLVENQSQP